MCGLQGAHGEVRILFELYECFNGQPRLLDYWEPEMTVMGKRIYESYTYTLPGQAGGETYNAFRKRLPKEIEYALVDFVRVGARKPVETVQQPVVPTPPEPDEGSLPPLYEDSMSDETTPGFHFGEETQQSSPQ